MEGGGEAASLCTSPPGRPPRQPCRPQGGPLALSGLQAAPRQRSSLVGGGTALHRGPELSLPGSRPLPAVSSTVGQTRTRVFSRSAVPSFSLQAVLAAELSRTAASLPPAHRLGAPPMGAPPPMGAQPRDRGGRATAPGGLCSPPPHQARGKGPWLSPCRWLLSVLQRLAPCAIPAAGHTRAVRSREGQRHSSPVTAVSGLERDARPGLTAGSPAGTARAPEEPAPARPGPGGPWQPRARCPSRRSRGLPGGSLRFPGARGQEPRKSVAWESSSLPPPPSLCWSVLGVFPQISARGPAGPDPWGGAFYPREAHLRVPVRSV